MGAGATCGACGAPMEAGQQFCTRCGSAARAEPRDPLRDRLQDLLGTEYEILDVVGRGGMAVVYAARDPLLERRVAVKAMLPEFAADVEMADRFLREARTAAQLQHPNIVSVYGARSRDDLLVMLMAFVEGRSVDAVLREQGSLPLPVAGRLAADMASALQYAHDRHVIHRDVKPANVLLASNGGALLSDFGIARRQDVPGMTGEGMLLGSLSYMSPEQRCAEALTGATDQYALGVSVFEMLTGRGPFVGTTIDVHVAHLNETPPSVREFRPDVPDAVARAIARMLAKTPGERFPNLREPQRVLERLVTDARSVSAEIAQLSGVLAAPTASRVISAVRKAPTAPMAAVSTTAARTDTASQATVATAAAPTVMTTSRGPHASSRVVLTASVAVALLIIGGAVVLKQRMTASAPAVQQSTVPTPADAGSQTAPAASAPSVGAPPASKPASAAARDDSRGAQDSRVSDAPDAASAGVPLPTATLNPRTVPQAAPSAPPAAAAPAGAEPARATSTAPAPLLADARAAARALVTMMNQRRARDLERLADAGGGEPAARRALERLVREGDNFAAGFDRMASTPEADGAAFLTEFVVEASWSSGGKDAAALYDVRLRITRQGDAWVPSGYSVRAR